MLGTRGTAASPSTDLDGPRGRGPSPETLQTELLLPLVERAHPDLGRLGVFWHTQGSGKSYSMLFFAEKVRRTVPDNFTFLVLTRHGRDRPWRSSP